MLSRINKALFKYYFLTLIFLLILFKRQVPKWMRKRASEVLELPDIMGEIEPYVK